MAEPTGADHDEIFALLPDYAVGDLSDADLARVTAHVDACGVCQRELSFLLETISLLTPLSRPSDSVRRAIVDAVQPGPSMLRAAATTPPPSAKVRRLRLAPLAAIAAALLIAASLAAWRFVLDDDAADRDVIAQLLLDPEAAHPINDSELDVGAGGAMFTDPDSSVAYLVASGLPAPGPDEIYRIWLFTEDGRRIAAGTVDIMSDGVGQAVVHAPEPFAAYWAVGVSLEPRSGSDAPTSPLVVGGWLQ